MECFWIRSFFFFKSKSIVQKLKHEIQTKRLCCGQRSIRSWSFHEFHPFFYCNRKNFLFIFHPSRSKVGIYHHCHNRHYSSSNQRCSLDSWSLIFDFNHNNNNDNDDGERQEIIWSIDWLINQVMKISIWISCWFE